METGMMGDGEFRKWLRRPSLFVANSLYLLAGAGAFAVPYIVYGLKMALGWLFPAVARAEWTYLPSVVYEIGVLALPAIWYAARHEGVSLSMRLNPPKPSHMLLAVWSAVVGVLFISNLGTLWVGLVEALGGQIYESSVPTPTNTNELMVSILVVGMLPGICEELLCRGILLGAWERRGTKYAVLVSTLFFIGLHGTILGLPAQAVTGLALGYIVVRSNSLYVSMAYHTTHNSMLMLLTFLAGQYMELMPEASEAAVESYSLLSMIPETLILGGIYVWTLSLLGRKQRLEKKPFEAMQEVDRAKMGWRELLVLLAGIITVGVLYLQDILLLTGALTMGG